MMTSKKGVAIKPEQAVSRDEHLATFENGWQARTTQVRRVSVNEGST